MEGLIEPVVQAFRPEYGFVSVDQLDQLEDAVNAPAGNGYSTALSALISLAAGGIVVLTTGGIQTNSQMFTGYLLGVMVCVVSAGFCFKGWYDEHRAKKTRVDRILTRLRNQIRGVDNTRN